MPTQRLLCAGLFGAILSVTASAALAVQAPQSGLFSAAVVTSNLFSSADTPDQVVTQFDNTLASISSPADADYLGPVYVAEARSDYGTNRSRSDVQYGEFGEPSVIGFSAWADRFVVSGGTGAFQATVSVTLSGAMGPWEYAEVQYLLARLDEATFTTVISQDPEMVFDYALYGLPELPAFQPLIEAGFSSDDYWDAEDAVPFSFTYTAVIEGEYDQPFYLLSALGTYADTDGLVDVMNTAEFGITGPAGSSILTGSGTSYPAAVPEPETWALFGLGLALLAFAGRRRRAA